jgi:hypothetical protein
VKIGLGTGKILQCGWVLPRWNVGEKPRMADMHNSDHFFEPRSLPMDGDFDVVEGEDRGFDLLLTQMLREIGSSPAGMADRVFQASVLLLPQRSTASEIAPLRFVPAARERMLVRKRNWSRLAMAASVALACVVGMKVCLPSHSVNTAMAAVSDADWGTFHGSETGNRSVSQLLRANEVSLSDLMSEMSVLASSYDAEM